MFILKIIAEQNEILTSCQRDRTRCITNLNKINYRMKETLLMNGQQTTVIY